MPNAHKNPNKLKLSSNELHKQRPNVIGIIENFVQRSKRINNVFFFYTQKIFDIDIPVLSPSIIRLIITVNSGEDDFIVATNDTAMYFKAIKPNITAMERNAPMYIMSRYTFLTTVVFLSVGQNLLVS